MTMDNIQFITILGAILGSFIFLFREMKDTRRETKLEPDEIKKDLQQLNTRVAVVESRLSDISTNVNHLMWHHQSLSQKDANEN